MNTKRIIPCLDIKNGRVVKGVNFVGLSDAGDPVEVAKRYNDEGADELVFLDITATHEGRDLLFDVLQSVARHVFIPLCVGGGIRSLDDFSRVLATGCDKVSINSAALQNPQLITDAAQRFGSQCVVVAIDIKFDSEQKTWFAHTHGGRQKTQTRLLDWAHEIAERGAGEILLTSMDADGTKAGYDLESLHALCEVCKLPIIASGGAGVMEHFAQAFNAGADAALAASVFHYQEIPILALKQYLRTRNIDVRL
ncbi:MAG: imidazole glycerol phosphate synthase subunit HisF [Helicobacter sp.]|nr:imidazole glycerol phosphate synthase subunit HisF [Helicobacter sp.]